MGINSTSTDPTVFVQQYRINVKWREQNLWKQRMERMEVEKGENEENEENGENGSRERREWRK